MGDRLFCYYGDDFTGSTDVLESLAANSVSTVLFLGLPTDEQLADFEDCRAIGIAGESRSRSPEWMAEELPPVFQRLRQFNAPICHYKVCSTFDSSPKYGSIGRALEIGQDVFETPYVPIVVAAPHLKRYVLFGNHFAAAHGVVHRIDRHPVMKNHPVTPMDEADLRLHLARQTERSIELLDIVALHGGTSESRLDEIIAKHPDAILFDGLDEASLRETGRLLWTRNPAAHSFAVGSSGLTYALIEHWRASGIIPQAPSPGQLEPVDRLIVISGSCSSITETQIRRATAGGFHRIRFDATKREAILQDGLRALNGGTSIVLYTALGPDDCRGGPQGAELGHSLGQTLLELLIRSGVRRVVVAGGDTSSHSVRQLGIHALTYVAQLTPGAPLCRGHAADHAALDGIELVLKGGQVGPEDFFERVLRGQR
jgi:uncharacterized protein YgbK (DUF1537 family)